MKTEKLKFSILGLNEGSNYEIEIYERQLPNFSFTVFQFMVHCEALNALSNSVLFLSINNSLSANQHLKIMHPAPKNSSGSSQSAQFTFSQQFAFFCNSIIQLQLQMIWTPTLTYR